MRRVVFPDPEALAAIAAPLVARRAAAAIAARGRFLVALAGGRTPLPVFRRLAVEAVGIDWQAVELFWTDERCVPPDHPASNYGTAVDALVARVPIPKASVHRMRGEAPPTQAASEYNDELERVLGSHGALDLVLLGVGGDGHTASLFGDGETLAEFGGRVAAVRSESAEPPLRLTLTLEFLNRSREALFLVTGKGKREALARIDRGEQLPASRVCPVASTPLWFVDRAAAPSDGTRRRRCDG